MMYIIIKCVEDKYIADVTLYDVTDTLPDIFIDMKYEHLNMSDGTKYAKRRVDGGTVEFVAKPISDYTGCHILTINK